MDGRTYESVQQPEGLNKTIVLPSTLQFKK